MKPDLFLFVSHVSEDRIAAIEIVEELERRDVRCWIAPRDVRPGKPFDDEIADAIEGSRAMLLIFSERCNESEYIRREVTVAGESQKVIIPFRIEDAQPRRGLRVRLSDLHWIDGFASRERAIDELVRTFHPPNDEPVSKAAADPVLREPTPPVIDKAGADEKRERAEKERRGRETEAKQQKSRRLLVAGSLVGTGLLGAVGVWIVIAPPAPVPPPTVVTPLPAPVAPAPVTVAPGPAPVAPPPAPQPLPAPSTLAPLPPDRERALQPRYSFKECDKCPVMVVVPAGSFTMGSPASEAGRDAEEGPQHKVTFAKQFAVGRFAVTFDEWDACIADSGCNGYRPDDRGWGGGRRPVIYVSWADANAYVAWLSKQTGKPYRLLTESEREYVMRAGTTTMYYFGDDAAALGQYAWYNANSVGQTHPVGEKKPNGFGLYDMHGNVWDWTEDCYHDSYKGAPADGSAWAAADCSRRVVRGGSWLNSPDGLRSANRGEATTDSRGSGRGFRVGRTLLTP